ncbi:hypothetical protein AAMO2058_000768600 [Amorphochlora amoebiformis]
MVSVAWTASDAAKCCLLVGFLGYSMYLLSFKSSGRVVTLRRLIPVVEISAIVVYVTLFPPLFLEWQARISIVDFFILMFKWCVLYVAYLVSIALYGAANMNARIPRILPRVLQCGGLVSLVINLTLLILALATDHLIYRGIMHLSVCIFIFVLGVYFVWNIRQLRLHVQSAIDSSTLTTSAQNNSTSPVPIAQPPPPSNSILKTNIRKSSRRHQSSVELKGSNTTKYHLSMTPLTHSSHHLSLQPDSKNAFSISSLAKVTERGGSTPKGSEFGGTPRGGRAWGTPRRGRKSHEEDATSSPVVTPRAGIPPRQSVCNRNMAKRLKLYRSLELKFRRLVYGAILVAIVLSVAVGSTGVKIMMLGMKGKKVSTYTMEILEQRKKEYRFLQDLSGWGIILLVWFLIYYSTPRRSSSTTKQSAEKF